jgi:hypothetical protein
MHRILCFAVIWIMPLSIIRCQPPAKSVSPADEAAADRAIDSLSQAREVAESQANTFHLQQCNASRGKKSWTH